MTAPDIIAVFATIIFLAALVAYRLRTPRTERLRKQIADEFSDVETRTATLVNQIHAGGGKS